MRTQGRLGLAAAAAAAILAGCARAEAAGDVTPSELLAAIQAQRAPVVLDVRTPEEFAGGHVPGARNIPIDQLPSRTGEIAASGEQEVVVYCERGPRARRGSEILREAGFTDVRLLEGHMSAWREAELPVER